LIDSFEPTAATQKTGEGLREYTKQMTRTRKSGASPLSTPYKPHNVEEFAHFEPEIDLHIQNLLPGYARLDKGEIVRIQLQHFQRFLDKAIRLGVPRVFVIHGVGEGILRDTIARQLRDNPNVRKFKNEYHHKYGYGATEVFLD
jgi:Smr domain